MNRSTAKALLSVYARTADVLNEADVLLRSIPDETERKELLRALGMVMAKVWGDLQSPVVRQFPDLDPDGKSPNGVRDV